MVNVNLAGRAPTDRQRAWVLAGLSGCSRAELLDVREWCRPTHYVWSKRAMRDERAGLRVVASHAGGAHPVPGFPAAWYHTAADELLGERAAHVRVRP